MCTLRSPQQLLWLALCVHNAQPCRGPRLEARASIRHAVKTECRGVPRRRGESPQCERPQRENAFVHRLAPPTAEGHAVHLTHRAPSWSSARGLEKKIECVNFRTSGVSFSRCAFCFVSFARPANGEGKPSRNAALRAPTRVYCFSFFAFTPSPGCPILLIHKE